MKVNFCISSKDCINALKFDFNLIQGSIYGLDHCQERFLPDDSALLRPATGIPGLFLTGQDIMSAGFVSALNAGLLCASAVLEQNLFLDVAKLHKESKPKNQ